MAEPFVMDTDLSSGHRLVWVLNSDTVPYTEKFKGDPITVPANNEKKLKMPYLEAREFLKQGKPLAQQASNGTYLIRPKALRTEELTAEEKKGTVNEIIEATKPAAMTNKCMVCGKDCGSEHGLKIHMANFHEGATPGDK